MNIPKQCQLCNRELKTIAYDCATRLGSWAWLCHSCWRQHGYGLGTGRGQKYDVQKKEKLNA